VIYLPTLAITAVSDMNPFIVASLVGILCILYTFLGGFEDTAVIANVGK
jgi:SSS family solute:Na+ symporter